MIRLRVELQSALSLLSALATRLAAPGGLLEPALPLAQRAIELNFDEEGRPQPWPPLTPATLRRKPAGLKILELTGRLRRSVSARVEEGRLILSTDVPYAAAHQFGFPGRRLPARPFLVLTAEDVEGVAESVAEALGSDEPAAGVAEGSA